MEQHAEGEAQVDKGHEVDLSIPGKTQRFTSLRYKSFHSTKVY